MDEVNDPLWRFSFHWEAILKVLFDDQLGVLVYVHVTRAMITFPIDEDVIAATHPPHERRCYQIG